MQHKVLGLWLPAGGAFPDDRMNAKRLFQKDVEVNCRGTNLTTWRAVTTGRIMYRGRKFETVVSTDEAELACSY